MISLQEQLLALHVVTEVFQGADHCKKLKFSRVPLPFLGSGGPRPVGKAVGGGVAGGDRAPGAGSSTLCTHAR